MSIIKISRICDARERGGFGSGCHYRSGIREDCIFTGCRYHHATSGLINWRDRFKQFAVTLREAQGDIPAVVMHYGVFIQNVFDFLIVAFAIFMAIKLINKLNRKKEEPAAATPAPTKEEVLLTEIRDLLKEQNNRS